MEDVADKKNIQKGENTKTKLKSAPSPVEEHFSLKGYECMSVS